MESFIVAARNDGFGERMCAMLNAMYIAKKTGWTFKFIWQDPPKLENNDQNVLLPWNDMLPQDLMFSKNFISQYATKDIPWQYDATLVYYKSLKEITQKPSKKWNERQIGHYSIQHYLGQQLHDINTNEYANILQECWNEIEFTPHIQHIITQAKCHKNLPTNFTAIHIRCGDILYYFHDEYEAKHKIANPYLAIEIIKREIQEDNSIILFSDDLSVLQNIKEQFSSTNKVFIIDDFFERTQHTRLEQSIFEIMIMSQAKKLYSGISGFSRLANMIGNNQHIIIYSLFNTQEQYDIISKHIQQYELPAIHKAFSYMYLFSLAQSLKMSPHTQKTYIQEAITLNPNSLTYKILFVYTLLLNENYKEANTELKSILEANKKFLDEIFKFSWNIKPNFLYNFIFPSFFIKSEYYHLYPYIAHIAYQIIIKLQDPNICESTLQNNYKLYFHLMFYISNHNNIAKIYLASLSVHKNEKLLKPRYTKLDLTGQFLKFITKRKIKTLRKSFLKRYQTAKFYLYRAKKLSPK
ncbi:hypothetical protein [Helicobacter pullorum]|uniref:hypothetical protein n=1 Tax=Helicobacter pullorum TaxID=35818 RepID=UPI0008169494|nr:hypothetical protein [Helicobacter pullorum]OCR10524.1 hypothetical protein A7X13_01960 [Helicobacter pullorum]